MTYRVAIVGATGAVGLTMLQCLEQRRFPVRDLALFASERSTGRVLHFRGAPVRVQPLAVPALKGYDYALFSAGATVSREIAREVARNGTVIVDNSSAWRMEADVPLVVPEVNAQDLAKHPNLIANPNCSTIQLVVVLKPLHDAARLKRVVVASYQAVSGAGGKGLLEFERNVRSDVFADGMAETKVFPRPIAFNAVPQIGEIAEDGCTVEERKVVLESRRILGLPQLRITATCARVPVRNAHSEAVNVEFEEAMTPARAAEVLRKAPGVVVSDLPVATEVSGKDEVFVGRIRADASVPSGLNLWVVGDNLRKGAALNAVQIAERLSGTSS